MSRSVPTPKLYCLLTGLLLLSAGPAMAQMWDDEEPRWLRLSIPQASVGVDVEGLQEDVRLGSSSSTHEYLSLTPVVGVGMQGSVYHPNLMLFDIGGEGGIGWTTDTSRGAGSRLTRNESRELLRFLVQARFLSKLPYNASFFAAQDHTYNNYDFFNTATVDTFRYGGRVSWTTPSFNLAADVGHRDERASGLGGTSEIAETYFNFNGTHKRQKGRSTLTYRYSEFDNTLNLGAGLNSVSHSIGVSDSETFGSRRQVTATTGASYSQYDYSGQQTETINASENITINLRPKLDSFLSFNYNYGSLHPSSYDVLQGTAGIRHRLYDSLTSTLDAHGTYDSSSSVGSSSSNDRYGLGLAENYTKRLGGWGRLSIGGGIVADHEDHQASGTILTSVDEMHQLFLLTNPQYRPAYLSQPRVIASSIIVMGTNGVAQKDVDYQVVTSGELTEIRLIQGSLVLYDGTTVRVSYQSESLFNSSFEALTGNAQIRLDLFNTFGIYARVNWLDNNAPPEVLTETLTDLVGGADYTWRWLRAGAEYEDFNSNFTKYDALRFFESASFQPFEASTLGAEFSQIFYSYPGDHRETRYQVTTRFNTQLTSWLGWYAEGGVSRQEVLDTDQNLFAARTGLTGTRGRLTIRAGYQFNYDVTTLGPSTEERNRNYFFVQLRRTF